MPELKDLIPRIKIADLDPGNSIKVDSGDYVVQVQVKADETVVTLEYVGSGPGWAVVKVVNPSPEADLADLIEVLKKAIDSVIQHQRKD